MIPSLDAPWRILPQGDRTLVLVLEQTLSMQTGQQCGAVALALRAAALRGVTDIVPSFNTVAVHYQPRLFGPATRFRNLAADIVRIVQETVHQPARPATRTIDIPVCYGGQHGPDLEAVARHCGLSTDAVIALHSRDAAYVFMLGFTPGAPYIGLHDAALDIARRDTPRTHLPAGSVAIANRQTVIYPNVSPGGWHILGATPLPLFQPEREPYTLLAPGDMVRFIPIDADEYVALKARS